MALTGKFSETPFADLVQFYAASRQTVAVTVTLPDGQGEDGVFYLEDGEVVDGFLGDAVGGDAVRRAMLLADGSFRVEPGIRAAERTITEPLQRLMLAERQQPEERVPARQELPPSSGSVRATGGRGGAGAERDALTLLAGGRTGAGPSPGGARGEPGPGGRGAQPGSAPARRRKAWTVVVAAAAILLLAVAAANYLRCGGTRTVSRAPRSVSTFSDMAGVSPAGWLPGHRSVSEA